MSSEYSTFDYSYLNNKGYAYFKLSIFSSFESVVFESYIEKLIFINYPFSRLLNEITSKIQSKYSNIIDFLKKVERNEITYDTYKNMLQDEKFQNDFKTVAENLIRSIKISNFAEILNIEVILFTMTSEKPTKYRNYDECLHLQVPLLHVDQEGQPCYYLLSSSNPLLYQKPNVCYSNQAKLTNKFKELLEVILTRKRIQSSPPQKVNNFYSKLKNLSPVITLDNSRILFQDFKTESEHVERLNPQDFQMTNSFNPLPLALLQFTTKNEGFEEFTKVLKENPLTKAIEEQVGSAAMCCSCKTEPVVDVGFEKICNCSLGIECIKKIGGQEFCPLCRSATNSVVVASYLEIFY
ncbi:hypothetical protein SteCoe_1334 [Stentor coeruleus]|uniref:Uncharacterized protein n=1 Tax=Stentor coeruleus TaxID=5963 RepID=A0A1R2D202_9CILI|nr:hypothetical protein SteCoe_1334 [Stentor coeruleus]